MTISLTILNHSHMLLHHRSFSLSPTQASPPSPHFKVSANCFIPCFFLHLAALLPQKRENGVEANYLTSQNHLMDPNSIVEAEQSNKEKKNEVSVLPSPINQMHHSFENHMPEDIQKVREITISDDNSEPVTETTHGLNSKEKEVASDSGIESEPSMDSANPVVVITDPFDVTLLESKETEGNTNGTSSPVAKALAAESSDVVGTALDESNGVSPLVMDVMLKGIEPISDENQGVSSVATGLVSNGVGVGVGPSLDEQNLVSSEGMEENSLPTSDGNAAADNGGENCRMSEVLQSPKEQPSIAAMASPAQRTSWKGCCGLFQVLTRFNQ